MDFCSYSLCFKNFENIVVRWMKHIPFTHGSLFLLLAIIHRKWIFFLISLFFQDYVNCPALGNILFAHPEDCSKFIECNDGMYSELNCVPGLLFDSVNLECQMPENAACFSQATTTPEPFNPEGECPSINPEFAVYLKDRFDCSVFYECDWGTPYKFKCPGGLHFNKELDICDWPQNVNCETFNVAKKIPKIKM